MVTRFLGLDFKTTKDTFIPRPETELLVKVCLDIIARHYKTPKDGAGSGAYILDIGTGAGNIAVSLTKMSGDCKILALDNSDEALIVAKKNAERLGVSDRVEFVKSDMFNSLYTRFTGGEAAMRGAHGEGEGGKEIPFNIIISNPPYIASWEIATLAWHVRSEPRAALDGGENGLDFYRRIISAAPVFLKDGGFLIMEMGYNQACYVKGLFRKDKHFTDIETFRDFSGIERIIKARWISSL